MKPSEFLLVTATFLIFTFAAMGFVAGIKYAVWTVFRRRAR